MIEPLMDYSLLQEFINSGLKENKSREGVGFGEGIKHEEENWDV
ncbi:hypothetical protein [Burkholderia pseudomallei]|jgi:hypothetical protein|nr:hypothetical protein [Burkholderia pseudomallei]